MHTPITTHTFSTDAPNADPLDPRVATPAVIVAGTRVSRELVRLFVAGAFVTIETVLRMGEWRVARVFERKRQA